MCEFKSLEMVTETEDQVYYVDPGDAEFERCFGVAVSLKLNSEDSACVKNLFFTRGEAEKCCFWLAQNDVEPIILHEVLSNFYQL